ncbi:MAG: ATP-binding cassette domain-containing protein, partial [Phycisphaerae bacterium]
KFCRGRQVLRLGEERRAVEAQLRALAVKVRDRNQAVSTLSGGNQQKIVLAKWLLTDPQIIILDEPTRGIDIGAKAEFYEIIRTLARQGRTIILVSSEMPELLGLCDRIIVLYQGEIAAEFKRGSFDQEEIIRAAIGQRRES